MSTASAGPEGITSLASVAIFKFLLHVAQLVLIVHQTQLHLMVSLQPRAPQLDARLQMFAPDAS